MNEFKQPFRHWTAEGLVPDALVKQVYAEVQQLGPDWSHWVRYSNDCESEKRTTREVGILGPACVQLFKQLCDPNFLDSLRRETGILVEPDPQLHGAGIHVTDAGGWLNPHLDYALHPDGIHERRLNLVLFLNPLWRAEWGGAFELWDDAVKHVKKDILPSFNQAVLWEPTDVAYHGTAHLARARCDVCQDEPNERGNCRTCRRSDRITPPPRVTAAVYYLCPVRPGVTRKRALFVPRRG